MATTKDTHLPLPRQGSETVPRFVIQEKYAQMLIYDNERNGVVWLKNHVGYHGDKHRPTARSICDALNEGRLKPLPILK